MGDGRRIGKGAELLELHPYRARPHNTGPISDLLITRGFILAAVAKTIRAHLRQVVAPRFQLRRSILQTLGHIDKVKRENTFQKLQETTQENKRPTSAYKDKRETRTDNKHDETHHYNTSFLLDYPNGRTLLYTIQEKKQERMIRLRNVKEVWRELRRLHRSELCA